MRRRPDETARLFIDQAILVLAGRRTQLPLLRGPRRRTRAEHSNRFACLAWRGTKPREEMVNGLIYLVGLIVIIMFILSFFGLR